MRRVARSPLLHFLLLGAIAAAVAAALPSDGTRGQPLDEPDALFAEALRVGLDQSPAVRQRLVALAGFLDLVSADAPAEERERVARDFGLVESDPVIRRYLAEAVRERLAHGLAVPTPSDDEVRAHVASSARAPARTTPRRFRLSHAYVGDFGDEARAARIADALRAGHIDLAEAITAGNAFAAGHHLAAATEREIAARFGDAFATAATSLEPGEPSIPIASAYGHHVVWLHEILPAREVPERVWIARARRELIRQREERALDDAIASLRGLRGRDGA